MPVYCVSTIISIALRAEKFDGRLHGHDVGLKACIEVVKVVDIVMLKDALRRVTSKYDHTYLEEVLGEGSLVEDLISRVLSEFLDEIGSVGIKATKAWIKAIIPDGEIVVSKEEASKWRV